MRKILVGYATAGIGHKKASLAIAEALKAKEPGLDVKLIDVLDYTNSFFRKTYPPAYLLLINKLIFLWGILYYFLDTRLAHFIFLPLRRFFHVLHSAPLIKFLREYKPDIVMSTHFLLPDVCYYVEKKFGVKIRVINVVTDYKPHSFWIADNVDIYIVGHDQTREVLAHKWKINPDKIKVMGIPVGSKFYVTHDRNLAKKKLDIPPDSFTALLLGGGYGVGPMFDMLKALDKSKFSLTVITVCGHNKKLFNDIELFKKNSNIRVINFAYVDNVDELMAASDIYIGKAGGISTTEGFTQDLPFVFIRPIPGQEKRNADLFIKMGAACRLKKTGDILKLVEDIKFSPGKLEKMRENVKKIKKPQAARVIADFVTALPEGD